MYIDFKIGKNKLEQFSIMNLTRADLDELFILISTNCNNHKDLKTYLKIRSVFNQAYNEIEHYDSIIDQINNNSKIHDYKPVGIVQFNPKSKK